MSLIAATSLFAVDELALRLEPALEVITPDSLLAHIKVLASDEFEGRAPGTKGEELSVKYIADQFKNIGLKPGNPDGTYIQEVPLAGIKSEPRMSFAVDHGTIDLKPPDDFVASSARLQQEIKINNSDVVFVGYGVVAPEYGWDDYKNVDVRGKTLLMLVGDPSVPDPHDPSKLDERMFKGKAMTYYGRWTYKLEEAARQIQFDNAHLINVDATIIAQQPKIMPHAAQMKRHIADALKLDEHKVGIKATTNELLGFIGREEGIAAMAVASIERPH